MTCLHNSRGTAGYSPGAFLIRPDWKPGIHDATRVVLQEMKPMQRRAKITTT
jgi:hypothetical protein